MLLVMLVGRCYATPPRRIMVQLPPFRGFRALGTILRVLFVGLTGGIGAGKSTVANRLVELGAVLIDSDRIAREVLEPGTDGLRAVIAEFGQDVLAPDGSLDRAAVATRVFADDAARDRLNVIVHPRVSARSAALQASAPADAVVVQDVPLLVEGGMALAFPLVVVVHAGAETRIRRVVEARGMSEPDARARVAAQATDEQRRAAADVWLDNSGSPEETRRQVDQLWTERLRPFEANLRAGDPAPQPRCPVLVPADPGWAAQAARVCARIAAVAEHRAHRVDHVGSTAVPELDAQDVLDVQVVVGNPAAAQQLASELAGVGLVWRAGSWSDESADGTTWDKEMAASADPGRRVDCHVRSVDSPAWREALLMRDWLRADAEARDDYAALKRTLATQQSEDPGAYDRAKTGLLHAAQQRAEGWAAASAWSV